jgi:hypothetical protein
MQCKSIFSISLSFFFSFSFLFLLLFSSSFFLFSQTLTNRYVRIIMNIHEKVRLIKINYNKINIMINIQNLAIYNFFTLFVIYQRKFYIHGDSSVLCLTNTLYSYFLLDLLYQSYYHY